MNQGQISLLSANGAHKLALYVMRWIRYIKGLNAFFSINMSSPAKMINQNNNLQFVLSSSLGMAPRVCARKRGREKIFTVPPFKTIPKNSHVKVKQ